MSCEQCLEKNRLRREYMDREEEMQEYNGNIYGFNEQLDMLSFTLSLKGNFRDFDSSLGLYELLFSTYIKMFKLDRDEFFIDKSQQTEILTSLERSKTFCHMANVESLQELLKHLRNNDPTDFMIFPISSQRANILYTEKALDILTVYKRANEFVVMQIGKEHWEEPSQVSHFMIPESQVESLSKIIFFEHDSIDSEASDILMKIEALSKGYQAIAIANPTLVYESNPIPINHFWIDKVEAVLKIVLFNCRTNEFFIETKRTKIPKWNRVHPDPTVEMRKRFLEAVKGNHQEWNDQFDYVFDYYLYRKGRLVKNSIINTENNQEQLQETLQFLFLIDPYIEALSKSNGDISTAVIEELSYQSKESTINVFDELVGADVINVPTHQLENALHKNEVILSILKERLPIINLPIAKEMTQLSLSRLEVRTQEITDELEIRMAMATKTEERSWFSHFVSKVMPKNFMDYLTPSREAIEQRQEFVRRVDMLALSLSLKGDDQSFASPENYELLFSTYIKMIQKDQDGFFIDPMHKSRIIHSLRRTIQLYSLAQETSLQTILENLRNNDPTDFMLIPIGFSVKEPQGYFKHICGLTIYKKEEQFFVMKIDKEQLEEKDPVSYVKVPLEKASDLSQLFFSEREFTSERSNHPLEQIEKLSQEFQSLPAIHLKEQMVGNAAVVAMESSLRTILYNCKKDLFHLNDQQKVTPKWGKVDEAKGELDRPQKFEKWWMGDEGPTSEMKKRFLSAVQGEEPDWNNNFQYIFSYYSYRKNICKKMEYLAMDQKKPLYGNLRYLFQHDPYIKEILDNGGQIPKDFDLQLKAKVQKFAESMDSLPEIEIERIGTSKIQEAIAINSYMQGLIQVRIQFTKIPIVKEISEYLVSCIERKNNRLQSEYRRRIAFEQRKRVEAPIYQTTTLSLTEPSVTPNVHSYRALPVTPTTSGNRRNDWKHRISILCEQAKTLSRSEVKNPEGEALLNKKKASLEK